MMNEAVFWHSSLFANCSAGPYVDSPADTWSWAALGIAAGITLRIAPRIAPRVPWRIAAGIRRVSGIRGISGIANRDINSYGAAASSCPERSCSD